MPPMIKKNSASPFANRAVKVEESKPKAVVKSSPFGKWEPCSQWVEKEVETGYKLQGQERVTWHKLPAKVLGKLAVVPGLEDSTVDGLFILIHLSTEVCIAKTRTEMDCQRVGEFINSKLFMELRETESIKLKSNLPEDVKAWLFQCWQAKQYEHPPREIR